MAAVRLLAFVLAFNLFHSISAVEQGLSGRPARTRAGIGVAVDSGIPTLDLLREQAGAHTLFENNGTRFLQSVHVADFLGVRPVEALHLPVPLNFVFLGFAQNGFMRVDVPTDELKAWFEQLDHEFPHVRVPLDVLTCVETGHCSSTRLAKRPVHTPSHVRYNYSCHVIAVDDHVTAVFTQAIRTFSRPLDPAKPAAGQQVDVEAFEGFVARFLAELGLHGSNTFLILNPDRDAKSPAYSYTSGLSPAEVRLLLVDAKRTREQLRSYARGPARAAGPPAPPHGWWQRPRQKFSVVDHVQSGALWLKSARKELEAYTSQLAAAKAAAGPGAAEDVVTHLIWKLVHGTPQQVQRVEDFLAQISLGVFPPFGGRIGVKLPYESCQVDAWIGPGRWLMLDLAAEASDWGPWVGGDGVKTRHSKPDVLASFDASLRRGGVRARRGDDPAAAGLRERLALDRQHRLADLYNQHAMAAHSAAVNQMAPGLEKPAIDPHPPELSLLSAELDVVETFAKAHCRTTGTSGDAPPGSATLCAELKTRALALMDDIARLHAHPEQAQMSLERQHGWDIFGSGHELDGGSDVDDGSEAGEARQLFMAQLGAHISSAMRHIVTPPTASWNLSALHVDTASTYASKVLFTLYLIEEERSGSGAGSPVREFNEFGLKAELERLRLPSQTFNWAVHEVSAATEPALANAIALSIRTAVGGDAAHPTRRTTYIDSASLAAQLRATLLTSGAESGDADQLEVPIMVLMMQRSDALFVDQHYFARALRDMVLVVHNKQSVGMHPVGVTCGGALVARKLSSTTAATLAAVAQFLGGLLPHHLGYSPLHNQVLHQWQWSVGQSPFSLTSQAPAFSQLQIDALWRSYLLDALDTSMHRVNMAVRLLEGARPSAAMLSVLRQHDSAKAVQAIVDNYASLGRHWLDVVLASENLDYATAAKSIPFVKLASEAVLSNAVLLEGKLQAPGCSAVLGAARVGSGGSLWTAEAETWLSVAVVGAVVMAWLCIGWASWRRKPKAKFN